MVAVIKSGASIRNVLHYNENKLKQYAAELIHSVNFAKDTLLLGFSDKIKTFEKLTSLNERTKLNSVHISLNFDPSEKLDKEILQNIADTYMQKIGFANQPYLVYEHHDSGHPHIHIVTTNIQHDGRRIKMQNIGRNQSETARKEIEKEFQLMKAQREQLKQSYDLKPLNAQKIQYGKSQTKRSITNVLDFIVPNYKYASLPELNAVLRQYNVVADRGSEESRTYKNEGLVYRILNDKGQKVGSPVKASDIYNKPTLKILKEKFEWNEKEKLRHKTRVKNAIDFAFAKSPGQSLEQLIAALLQEKIQIVLRRNDTGIIYGVTYVDHQTRCVFNGSDLGKQYSANQLQERCKPEQQQLKDQQLNARPSVKKYSDEKEPAEIKQPEIPVQKNTASNEILKELTHIEYDHSVPRELFKEQKKKKKKRLRH